MLKVVGLVVVLMSSVASADEVVGAEAGRRWQPEAITDVWFDVGLGVQTVAPGDGVQYTGEMVRFAPTAAMGRHFYLGAGFSAAHITSASGTTAYVQCPANYTDEMCEGLQHDPLSQDSGTILDGQVVVGLRDTVGRFAGSVELAPTLRYTNGNFTKDLLSVTLSQKMLEVHARLDAWITPYLTVGVFGGMDTASVHDLQAALQIGVHLYPYDRKR
ncbi:MAG: hypothetical protein QM831_25460 [Kofleriaceae bacterium]